jgi:LysR family transcriptional regulator of gallate degradation
MNSVGGFPKRARAFDDTPLSVSRPQTACDDCPASKAPAFEPNLRRLRSLLAVHECGSVHRAGEKLHVTQSALTRAIRELERDIGRQLFERTSRGMSPTDIGQLVIARAKRAFTHLYQAEAEILSTQDVANSEYRARDLAHRATHRHLQALVAIADYNTETGAAQYLSRSQPAVTLALGDLERLVGDLLFTRTARGMIPTVYGEILIRHAKLVFGEITSAIGDIVAHEGVITGRVVVGALPLSGAFLMPRAINLLLAEHPEVQVTVVDGTYQSLMQGLRCGDVDIIVGGLSQAVPEFDVVHEQLFEDQLVVVARSGHPLAHAPDLSLADLSHAEWVLPRKVTPGRARLDDVMGTAGLHIDGTSVESNSLPTIRGLLVNSDRLSVISRHQLYFEEVTNLLIELPVALHASALPIGLRTLANSSPSASAKALSEQFRRVGRELIKIHTDNYLLTTGSNSRAI